MQSWELVFVMMVFIVFVMMIFNLALVQSFLVTLQFSSVIGMFALYIGHV